MGEGQGDKNGKRPGGAYRLQWLATIASSPKYSRLQVQVAGLLAWRYSDARTGKTFVGVKELKTEIGAQKRAVQGALLALLDDGFLEKTAGHAPGRPVTYRLVLPTTPPATVLKPPKVEAAANIKVWDQIENWRQFARYAAEWLNAEKNRAAIQVRWKSEKPLRERVFKSDLFLLRQAERLLDQRVDTGRCAAFEVDEEIPF